MFKYILLLSLLLLPSCTLNPFATPSRMDIVEVVKYTPYTKIHQLYIPRDKLQKFKNHSFFKYFYSKRKKNLYILTQNAKYYFLYNVTQPNTKKITINKKKYPYPKLLKQLRTGQILHLQDITPLTYEIETHYRKLSGVRTLYIKITNYQKLQKAYQKALSSYEAKNVYHLPYILPKKYIYAYYLTSKKNARTNKEKKNLSLIARKLGFIETNKTSNSRSNKADKSTEKGLSTKSVPLKKKTEESTIIASSEEENTTVENEPEAITADTKIEQSSITDNNINITKNTTQDTPYKKKPPYQYFLLSSDIKEIHDYLQEAKKTKSLSPIQYKKLLARKIFLKEAYLLEHANIAELIRAYKINQKPTFKKRIMELMKEKQEAANPIQK